MPHGGPIDFLTRRKWVSRFSTCSASDAAANTVFRSYQWMVQPRPSAARASAFLAGRGYVSPQDVKDVVNHLLNAKNYKYL